MKKHVLMAAGALLAVSSLFAYNPPAGGQNLLRYSSPFALSGANSTAGGPVYDVIPSSVVTNPALPAFEQRIALDLGFTVFFDKNKELITSGNDKGTAFQAGVTLPTRWCVPTFLVQGVFAPLHDMNLANDILFTGNVSKDITDKVSVGLGVTTGGYWNDNASDWLLAANTGVFYRHGDFFFLKDVRFAFTLMNLGKMFGSSKTTQNFGIKGSAAEKWPGLATPRGGIAFLVVDKGDFKLGGSTDVASPAFQNFVLDLGFALEYSGLKFISFKLASAWELDLRELLENNKNLIPSAALSVKFNLNTGANETMKKRGWQESELTVAGGWRNLYTDINAVSAGAVLKLGTVDRDPPVITLWDEEN